MNTRIDERLVPSALGVFRFGVKAAVLPQLGEFPNLRPNHLVSLDN